MLMQMWRFFRNPGVVFYRRSNRTRQFYKSFVNALFFYERAKRTRLRSSLPAVSPGWEISQERGYKILSNSDTACLHSAGRALQTCDRIIATGQSKGRGKSYMRHLLNDSELKEYPDLFDFCLDPQLISTVTDYLKELPVLTAIKILHSVPVEKASEGSQLYHCDHDDVSQVKVFLHISDVDSNSGPLTIIPSAQSQKLRVAIDYRYGGIAGHIQDKVIEPFKANIEEIPIIGSRGTLALVDTSKVFHFGSRVATRERYLLLIQYTAKVNFLFNPIAGHLPKRIARHFSQFPYANFTNGRYSSAQNAVLTGMHYVNGRAPKKP